MGSDRAPECVQAMCKVPVLVSHSARKRYWLDGRDMKVSSWRSLRNEMLDFHPGLKSFPNDLLRVKKADQASAIT